MSGLSRCSAADRTTWRDGPSTNCCRRGAFRWASTVVRRLLPSLGRRMVGAWCFVDHYGPDDITDEPGMQVPPHPHIGLQTVSWLHGGEVLHRDSLGSLQTIRPKQLGLMTAGRAISHSEESPRDHSPSCTGRNSGSRSRTPTGTPTLAGSSTPTSPW